MIAEKRPPDARSEAAAEQRSRTASRLYAFVVVAAFLSGLLISYAVWGLGAPVRAAAAAAPAASQVTAGDGADVSNILAQVNPPEGYPLGVQYADLGPRLIAAGVIDYQAFAAIYDSAGTPLTPAQSEALQRGSDTQIVITPQDAHFLLNLFWAVGLANKNPILTEGAMVQYGQGKVDQLASTGGWSIGSRPLKELYASLDLIPLTPAQQNRLEAVASVVYRPCCDNSTAFPDCNHGMAMLGLLEMMASQGASEDDMFRAAKYVNAYWFPQQALETAMYLKTARNIDFAQVDPRLLVGPGLSSGSGFARIHQALQASGQLPQQPGQGGNCAN